MAYRLCLCACSLMVFGTSPVDAVTRWTRGEAASLSVDVSADAISYVITVAARDTPWLQSEQGSSPRLFCGGAWQTTTLGAHTELSSADPKLGTFDELRVAWAVGRLTPGTRNPACAGKRIETTFTYYSDHDALAFSQSFPDEIADTTTPPQPYCPKCQFNSTSVPRSEFPAFSAGTGTTLYGEIGWWQYLPH